MNNKLSNTFKSRRVVRKRRTTKKQKNVGNKHMNT
jgi:hypothetical protein